jgi:F-type H+-transporting ATPase subunit epsilon
MANTIHVDVVSAEELIFSGAAEFVVLPAEMGEIGILPMHAPLITRIRPGAVRIKRPGRVDEEYVFVAGGILEVLPHSVTVLADTAIRGRDLDEAKAIEARQQAEDALINQASNIDYAKAQAEIATAMAQLALIKKLRQSRH